MSHNIKDLRPNRQSRYHQGYINIDTCHKLIDKSKPVIFRSSYERKFVTWLEICKDIKSWGSECICINYLMPDGSTHHYYPDYYVERTDGTRYIIEIKPSNQTQPPSNENSWLYKEWVKNCCKWKAAMKFCESHNLQFKIITENTINKLH